MWQRTLIGAILLMPVLSATAAEDEAGTVQKREEIRIGAVAYSPSAVTVFKEIRAYLRRNGLPADYVLYSNYDALVEALRRGEVDIAWNTPMAHARYHVLNDGKSQTLVMRDVDCNLRSVIVARADSGIDSLDDLNGKTLVLGSNNAAEVTALPIHFLKREGVDFTPIKILSLHGEVDSEGNPCSSPRFVLKAVQQGRGDAGIIGERLWNRIQATQAKDATPKLKLVWTSPPFSHCVFTAAPEFDKGLAQRFTSLMIAMDPTDPATAKAMRLEGTRQWLPGSPDGFEALVEIVRKKTAEKR